MTFNPDVQRDDTFSKWWEIEVVFSRRLKKSEVNKLIGEFYNDWDSLGVKGFIPSGLYVGIDGLKGRWEDKWPSNKDWEELIAQLSELKIPFKCRAAPYGRDCPGHPDPPYDDLFCETWSNAWSCLPQFTESEWVYVDPNEN